MLKKNTIYTRLNSAVISLRKWKQYAVLNQPRFIQIDRYKIGQTVYKRLRIILQGNGCSIPLCTMCPMPNEGVDRTCMQVNANDYIEQVRNALIANPSCEIISLYNDGSFFSSRELPDEARLQIYRNIQQYGCRYLIVESSPELITRERIEEILEVLHNVKVVVGIGLQSESEGVRGLCINNRITSRSFLSSLALLREYGVGCKTYVMVKPPFLTEEEAIIDAVSSAKWLLQNDIKDVTLCPTRVVAGTLLQDIYDRGYYIPPKLSTIVNCLQHIRSSGRVVRLSLFNVNSPDMAAVVPGTCMKCKEKIKRGLLRYNSNPWTVLLSELRCPDCERSANEGEPVGLLGKTLPDRVRAYLDEFERRQTL